MSRRLAADSWQKSEYRKGRTDYVDSFVPPLAKNYLSQPLYTVTIKGIGEGCGTTSILATCLKLPQPRKSMHEDVVFCYKLHCHKMARIARCGVAFAYASLADDIFEETLGEIFGSEVRGCPLPRFQASFYNVPQSPGGDGDDS